MLDVRILLVEDDPRVAHLIERALGEAGYRVDLAIDGTTGLELAQATEPDAIVLDVMLPVIDGLQVCRELRRRRVRTPILMLTARDSIPDRVRGLDAGADDYLTKPFALEELLARVRALVRRGKGDDEAEPLTVGDLTLNPVTRDVRRADREIELTAKEFSLLQFLMQHPGRVLTKAQIMDEVWGYDTEVTSNVVEIYIHYLRDRIDKESPRPLIRTIRGVGYTVKP
jgi:DNA-binding response OmpR family regulator